MGLKGKARQRANKKAKNQIKNMGFLRQKSLRENIKKWNDPILTTKCENVEIGENVVDIIKKMKSTLMATRNGVGLAAPQIGFTKNIIVIRSNRVTNEMSAYINPVIKEFGEKREIAPFGERKEFGQDNRGFENRREFAPRDRGFGGSGPRREGFGNRNAGPRMGGFGRARHRDPSSC